MDIICLSETYLNSNIQPDNGKLEIPDTLSKCPGEIRSGGFPGKQLCWNLEKFVALTEIEYYQHSPRSSDWSWNLTLEIPFQDFNNGFEISSFSSNTLKLTWVPWKLLSFL